MLRTRHQLLATRDQISSLLYYLYTVHVRFKPGLISRAMRDARYAPSVLLVDGIDISGSWSWHPDVCAPQRYSWI